MKKERTILQFIILILSVILIGTEAKGQELPIYSQYVLNPFLINPSVAGISGSGVFQLMGRTQWLGTGGAPQTFLASYHQGVGNSVGLGGYIYNDKNGNTSNLGMQLSYAYHFYIKKSYLERENRRLSLGLSLSTFQRKIDLGSNPGFDPAVTSPIQSSFIPNANAGLYYTMNNFFSGLTLANLIPTSNQYYVSKRTYFLQFGKTIPLRSGVKIEPSLTTKCNEQMNWQLDGNFKVYSPEKAKSQPWLGLSVRNDLGYSFKNGTYAMLMAGVKINKLRFAYAFEYGFNTIRLNNWGSHEFMIMYNFYDFEPCRCPAYDN